MYVCMLIHIHKQRNRLGSRNFRASPDNGVDILEVMGLDLNLES